MHMTNKVTRVLMAIYLIGLFWIIVFKFNIPFSYMGGTRSANLVPFAAPTRVNGRVDYGEMILNVLIFVPLGMYSGALNTRWAMGKQLVLFFLISLACEGTQYVLAVGAFDITDIINNMFGGLIGWMIYKGLEKMSGDANRAQKIVNLVTAIGTISLVSLLLYLKLNHLWIFRMGMTYR
jgi:glycopeptide antibiotics resistance protein